MNQLITNPATTSLKTNRTARKISAPDLLQHLSSLTFYQLKTYKDFTHYHTTIQQYLFILEMEQSHHQEIDEQSIKANEGIKIFNIKSETNLQYQVRKENDKSESPEDEIDNQMQASKIGKPQDHSIAAKKMAGQKCDSQSDLSGSLNSDIMKNYPEYFFQDSKPKKKESKSQQITVTNPPHQPPVSTSHHQPPAIISRTA